MSNYETIRGVYERATKLHSREEVEAAMDRMANDITEVLSEKDPIILCIMRGGVAIMGGLLSRLQFPMQMDYIHVTRYHSTTSGSVLKWIVKPEQTLDNRAVLIVDDVLDGGQTLAEIIQYCDKEGASEVHTAVLVDKPEGRSPEGQASADFTGLTVGNHYIFGYGMDYKEYLRNAPGIYAVAEQDK